MNEPNLIKMFNTRDEQFETKTIALFRAVETAVRISSDFLIDIDPMCSQGDLIWEDLNLNDGLVIMMGMVFYKIGDILTTESNEDVLITDENLDYYQRVIHMTMPLNIVLSKDEDEITTWLYEMHSEQLLDTGFETIESGTRTDEFDLSDLTEEQRQSLMLYQLKRD